MGKTPPYLSTLSSSITTDVRKQKFLPFGGGPRNCIGRKLYRSPVKARLKDLVLMRFCRAIRAHRSLIYSHPVATGFLGYRESGFSAMDRKYRCDM